MYKDLSDGHLISDKIENNEAFPVGGTSRNRNNTFMVADFSSFEGVFESIKRTADALKRSASVKDWYGKLKLDFDYSLFCHMLAFTNVIQKNYPDIINVRKHNGFYDAKTPKKLSEAVEAKACACTEFSVLAQGYFQSQNIPTRYVSGDVVTKGDTDDFGAHSFIALSDGDKQYIYDPVNVIKRADGSLLPRVAEVIDLKSGFMLETKSMFNKDRWYYASGEKRAFLTNLPTKKSVIPMKEIITINGGGRG